MGFKKDFIWGGATASYQVEGAAYEDVGYFLQRRRTHL